MPKRLVFNDPSGVDAPAVGEEDYPPGFDPVHLFTDPSTSLGDGLQTVDNDGSFKRLLGNFTKVVVRKRAFPLICVSPKLPPAKVVLSLWSKHLAAQSLSRVPASKRGNILIMQRMGLVTGLSTPNASMIKTYDALYEANPTTSNVEVLEALFQGGGKESRRRQQKRKPPS